MIYKLFRTSYILLIATIFGCGNKNSPPAEEVRVDDSTVTLTQTQIRAAGIELGRITKQSMAVPLPVNGKLDVPPQNMITISAPMGGYVKSTKLLQGMKVRKGELLVTLENQEYIQLQQEYLQNESKLAYAENEYKRQQALSAENVNAEKTLQLSKSEFESLKALVDGLKAKLKMINIDPQAIRSSGISSTINLYAPTNGYVTVVNVNLGQFVNPSDQLFRIVNLEHIHAEVYVYEKDVTKIKIGQRITFHLQNDAEERTGTIYLIGKEIEEDRTVRVHCHMDKEDESLLPGMFITGRIHVETREVDVLPSVAVVHFQGEKLIFIKEKDGAFRRVPVSTGITEGKNVQVTLPEGFEQDQQVVVSDAYPLLGLLKNKEDDE